jgi:hypothetical protein
MVFYNAAHGRVLDLQTFFHMNPKVHPSILEDPKHQRTVMHVALASLHNILSMGSSFPNISEYKDVVKVLSVHVDLSRWCPVVDAVHYRLVEQLDLLLSAMTVEAQSICLSELDSNSEHVLHVSVKSKASGFARYFLRAGGNITVVRLSSFFM